MRKPPSLTEHIALREDSMETGHISSQLAKNILETSDYINIHAYVYQALC